MTTHPAADLPVPDETLRAVLRAAYGAGADDLLGDYEGIGAAERDIDRLFERWLVTAHPGLAERLPGPPESTKCVRCGRDLALTHRGAYEDDSCDDTCDDGESHRPQVTLTVVTRW